MIDDRSEVGPVDYLVVEFPGEHANITSELASELERLVDDGTIRLLDLVVLRKDASGAISVFEIDQLDPNGELSALLPEIAEILTAKDLAHLSEAMQEDSAAAVVVWENHWATTFAHAARQAGGLIVANGKITTAVLAESLEADAHDAEEGTTRPVRARRRGVIALPVARSASTVRATAMARRGVARRRSDRRVRHGWSDDIGHNG